MKKTTMPKKSTSTRTPATTIDEYLALHSAEVRDVLQRLRETIRSAAPTATECISYQIPAFKHYGPLVGFAAFKSHCSFFVMNTGLVEKFKAKLKGYELGKSTVQFTIDKPIPVAVVKALVKARVTENETRKK